MERYRFTARGPLHALRSRPRHRQGKVSRRVSRTEIAGVMNEVTRDFTHFARKNSPGRRSGYLENVSFLGLR